MPNADEDHAAIAQLVARFDDAVNRRDVAEFQRLWTEDAVWEIGNPQPLHAQGREQVVQTWQGMLGSTVWLFRGSFAGVVQLAGDTASGRWPCIETGTFKDGRGYDNRALYEDRYQRTPQGWRFSHRRYLYLWLSGEKLPGNAVPLGQEIAPDAPASG